MNANTSSSDTPRQAGWGEHERFHLETGKRMSFRARLQWLENADRTVRFLARKRRWIDKDGIIHEA